MQREGSTGRVRTDIAERLEQLPNSPGVYLMRDEAGVIVYIGKAKNLRNRVRSYFSGRETDHRAAQFLHAKARSIDWILTDTELEALILEANLIRKHSPKYNVRLRDDKHFPYIKVTMSEPFPRVLVVRKVVKGGDKYFGPYTDSRAMRDTLSLIREMFRVRDCDLKLPERQLERPCLSHFIGKCDAPCTGLVTQLKYREMIAEVLLILEGRAKQLTEMLIARMKEKAAAQEFEEAGRIRDQLRALEHVQTKQKMDLGESVDLDIVALARQGKSACMAVFQVRDGFVSGRRHHFADCPLEEDDGEVLGRMLLEHYPTGEEIPGEILVSTSPSETTLLEEHFTAQRGRRVSIQLPRQGRRFQTVRLVHANAAMLLGERIAHREKRTRMAESVASLQEALSLPQPPRRIEGFDISHLGGTGTVASMVCFIDGRPAKQEYRKYQIKSVEGIDDFASMREIIGRRVRRLHEEGKPLPDLFLIDGGKGQLHAACLALEDQGVAIEAQPILGLAKRLEEVFLPGRKDPIFLPVHSTALRLLQQVRDEAHRFAVDFQRSQRTEGLHASWLDGITGIGPQKKMLLLQHFGSVARIRQAGADELAQIVGSRIAERIVERHRSQLEDEAREAATAISIAAEAGALNDRARGRAPGA